MPPTHDPHSPNPLTSRRRARSPTGDRVCGLGGVGACDQCAGIAVGMSEPCRTGGLGEGEGRGSPRAKVIAHTGGAAAGAP